MVEHVKDELLAYWRRHPAAYIAFRKEQMERCKFKNGKVRKRDRRAYDYYRMEIFKFEMDMIARGEL